MTDMYSHKLAAVILPGIVRRRGRAFAFLLHCNVLNCKETMARKHVLPEECGFQPRSAPCPQPPQTWKWGLSLGPRLCLSRCPSVSRSGSGPVDGGFPKSPRLCAIALSTQVPWRVSDSRSFLGAWVQGCPQDAHIPLRLRFCLLQSFNVNSSWGVTLPN